MTQLPGIAITGVSGRMGRMLVEVITASGRAKVCGATERAGHDWIGRDLGQALGGQDMGVTVSADLETAAEGAVAVIDFTAPAATLAFAPIAARAGIAHIIGTTGFSGDDLKVLGKVQGKIVRAGNMSLGVNLLVQLTKQVAAALDDDFDIEIIEAHHNQKVDAPSGTALMLGEAAAEGRGVALAQVSDKVRDGITGARQKGHIGFAAIRGGDIIGEHDVLFASAGERITLRHVASDRAVFARGALKAALWSLDRPRGHYSMRDVLGL